MTDTHTAPEGRRTTRFDPVDIAADGEVSLVLPTRTARPGADETTPATATLKLVQEAPALGDPVLLATVRLVAPGATLASTPESLGLAWKSEGKVAPFKSAVLAKGSALKVTGVERNRGAEHLVRSRCGKGRYSSVKTSPLTDRGGYMFAPASTADAELTPDWLWRNAQPRQEKVLCVGVQLEGEKAEHRLPLLHANTLAPADRWGAVTVTLRAVLELAAGDQTREHPLPGPSWELPAFEFLDDATAHAEGRLDAQLKSEYGNPKQSPPLHARDWTETLSSATDVGRAWRSAVQQAVTFVNARLPADPEVRLSEWEVGTTFLTEGGYSSLRSAIEWGDLKTSYSGYGALGIDSYVTRWRGDAHGIRAYTAPTLEAMIRDKRNLEVNTNEANDTLETFAVLDTQDACYAVAGLVAEAKVAFAQDLRDPAVVGPWAGRVSDLPEHVQFFWVTLYYNTGTANGRSTLKNQGLRYHDNVWFYADDHSQYARFEKFNANWRTATFRLFRAAFPTWTT